MSNWISVKNSLPKMGKPVLVFYSGVKGSCKPRVDTSFFMMSRCFSFEDVYGRVTHWMPLPAPPKEVENE